MVSLRLVIAVALALFYPTVAQYAGMGLQANLSPRYYLGELVGRQSGVCTAGSKEHICLDVNNATSCCANDKYCMVDLSFNAICCAIGSNCGITACNSASYICPSTITNSGTATVTASCCARSCPLTSQFKCDGSFGGGCCGYGFACASDTKCIFTATPTPSAKVSQIPSGCSASQTMCPTSVGGGCCNKGLGCTVVNNINYCAAPTGMATRTGLNGVLATAVPKPASSGLSTGAKAGIGGRVAGGACVIVGILLWFCLAHRRRFRSEQSFSVSGPEMAQSSEAGMKSPSNERQASDYFGPAASRGPFTENSLSPRAGSPAEGRGVPTNPHSPLDIATPVEIDSRQYSNVTSPGLFDYSKSSGTAHHPVELP